MSAAQIALEALQRIRDDLYGFLLSDDFDAETIVKASETLLPNLHDVALAATKSLEAEIAQELEPVDCQFQGADGRWHSFINEQHKTDTIASGKFLIRELFTAPQAVNAWQPIETAPKSSKAILVHCAGRKNTYTATWVSNEEFPWSGKWKHFAGDFLNEAPTHWMPLPGAPA